MSVPPPPPPPPPPSASIKAPIPVTNKALLTSIQKGTKLKKVPESAKNDRSEAKLSTKPTSNGPQMRSANGTQLGTQDKLPRQQSSQMAPAPNKQIDFHSELANQINFRKTSLPASNPPPIRPVMKSNVPLPNQFNSMNNKPPPPPPVNKKPLSSSNAKELSRPMSDTRDNIDKPFVQPPALKKIQPPIPNQLSIRPVSSVSRTTPNPPPPLSSVPKEATKPQISLVNPSQNNLTNPPRVPARVTNLPTNSIQLSNQNRTSSMSENQYKVDRAPPPPPSNQNRIPSNSENQYKVDRAPPPPPSNQNRIPSMSENQYRIDRAPPAPPSNQNRIPSMSENQYKVDRAPPPPPSNQNRIPSMSENQYRVDRAHPAPPSNQNRIPSMSENQYRVDRDPPPPLMNNHHQRMLNFDSRFKFPDERSFPKPQNMRSC